MGRWAPGYGRDYRNSSNDMEGEGMTTEKKSLESKLQDKEWYESRILLITYGVYSSYGPSGWLIFPDKIDWKVLFKSYALHTGIDMKHEWTIPGSRAGEDFVEWCEQTYGALEMKMSAEVNHNDMDNCFSMYLDE